MRDELEVQSTQREQLIDITDDVQKVIARRKIADGVCFLFTLHTTAALTVNENADPDVVRDILYGLRKIVPETGYQHGEGNSPAHIKSSLIGCSLHVLVENGRLVLGTWQGIYFCEFDGPRNREILVQIIGSGHSRML